MSYILVQNPEWRKQLLRPFWVTPPNHQPPLTLHEAQDIAVAVWKAKDQYRWLFEDTDAEVAVRFPEVALVGVHAKYERWNGDDARRSGPKYPGRAGLLVIHELFGPRSGPERGENAFDLEFYERYRPDILEKLGQEMHSGMTFWRYLTGFDRPWEVTDPNSWANFDPIDRLRMMVPEAFVVKKEELERFKQQLPIALRVHEDDTVKEIFGGMLKANNLFPELAALPFFCYATFSEIAKALSQDDILFWVNDGRRVYSAIYDSHFSDPQKVKEGLDILIEEHTTPRYIAHLRALLKKPKKGDSSLTLAEVFTGTKKPWLPELEAAPAGAPSPVETERKYGLEEHRSVAKVYADKLTSPDPIAYKSPSAVLDFRLKYRIYSNPKLMKLGELMVNNNGDSRSTPFSPYLKRALDFLRNDLFERTQVFSLQDVQDAAVKAFEMYQRQLGDSGEWYKMDELVEARFPEAAKIGLLQMGILTPYVISTFADRIEFQKTNGEIAALIAVTQHRLPPIPHLNAEGWIDFYATHRETILTTLGEELYSGMTRARWLTGMDEPWKPLPKTWDELPSDVRARLQNPTLPVAEIRTQSQSQVLIPANLIMRGSAGGIGSPSTTGGISSFDMGAMTYLHPMGMTSLPMMPMMMPRVGLF
ncbi:MAG: hypothetical protein HY540_05310 [Deltaproteobacteria bacterium]|nr:hypothetical protein [Deltaproteobacteria bacterium]